MRVRKKCSTPFIGKLAAVEDAVVPLVEEAVDNALGLVARGREADARGLGVRLRPPGAGGDELHVHDHRKARQDALAAPAHDDRASHSRHGAITLISGLSA